MAFGKLKILSTSRSPIPAAKTKVGPPLNRSFATPIAGLPYRKFVGMGGIGNSAASQPFAPITNPTKKSNSAVGYFQ